MLLPSPDQPAAQPGNVERLAQALDPELLTQAGLQSARTLDIAALFGLFEARPLIWER